MQSELGVVGLAPSDASECHLLTRRDMLLDFTNSLQILQCWSAYGIFTLLQMIKQHKKVNNIDSLSVERGKKYRKEKELVAFHTSRSLKIFHSVPFTKLTQFTNCLQTPMKLVSLHNTSSTCQRALWTALTWLSFGEHNSLAQLFEQPNMVQCMPSAI